MVDISTTRAALIKSEWSHKVPSPAYDSMTPTQRRENRLANPWSFLNVTLSPEDIAPQSDTAHQVSNDQLITLSRESLDRITTAGAFSAPRNCLFLYRLQRDNHIQTAIVTEVATDNYQSGQVKIHEQVKESRAQLLAEHLNKLKVISSPIAMTYRNTGDLSALVSDAQRTEPALELQAISGVTQTIWAITDPTIIQQLKECFTNKSLYIIDGHHRAAATVAANAINQQQSPLPLFSALFPHDELKLLSFNRWVKPADSSGTTDRLLALSGTTEIAEYQIPEPAKLTIYTDGQWFSFALKITNGNNADNTDAALLQAQLLQPVFGIDRGDHPHVTNMPGNQPVDDLRDAVDRNGGTAVYVAPMSIDDFLAVADSDDLLPPKSTYFTPKVQSGIFLRSL